MNERASGPSTAAEPHTTPALQIPKVIMSRQPIYDAQRQICAYVLSPQPDTSAPYGEETSAHNVQELIYYTFLETGLDQAEQTLHRILDKLKGRIPETLTFSVGLALLGDCDQIRSERDYCGVRSRKLLHQ